MAGRRARRSRSARAARSTRARSKRRASPARVYGSEDCLTLNVSRRARPARCRGASAPARDGLDPRRRQRAAAAATSTTARALARAQNVVVVTRELPARAVRLAAPRGAARRRHATTTQSGNFGTLDLVRALRLGARRTSRRSAAIPSSVTIFGESAGGAERRRAARCSPRARGPVPRRDRAERRHALERSSRTRSSSRPCRPGQRGPSSNDLLVRARGGDASGSRARRSAEIAAFLRAQTRRGDPRARTPRTAGG